MLHSGRIFHVVFARSQEELIKRLSAGRIPLCSGIYHQGLLLLNDSYSQESQQKFSLLKSDSFPTPGRWELNKIGSLILTEGMEAKIAALMNDLDGRETVSKVVVQIDGPEHRCPLCC
jgi:hypothetical protein